MKKYRIVTDLYSGFEVQESYLYFFWKQSKGYYGATTNSFKNIEDAKNHIERLKIKVVYKN